MTTDISPTSARQIVVAWSSPTDAILDPSGLKAANRIPPERPSNVATSLPLAMSQIFVVPSRFPVTTRWPSGLNPTESTTPGGPCRIAKRLPLERSQMRAEPSVPPATSRPLSGLNAAMAAEVTPGSGS